MVLECHIILTPMSVEKYVNLLYFSSSILYLCVNLLSSHSSDLMFFNTVSILKPIDWMPAYFSNKLYSNSKKEANNCLTKITSHLTNHIAVCLQMVSLAKHFSNLTSILLSWKCHSFILCKAIVSAYFGKSHMLLILF